MAKRIYAIMIILRIFLYLICIISVAWSILVFGGPPIIKRLISVYSEGALKPSGITVSPRLDISINQLQFNFQNEIAKQHIEGFSRAVKIEWSLSDGKPFLEINFGPSLVKGFATAESVKFFTPSFKKIDFQNISVVGNLDSLALNSVAKIQTLSLSGNFNAEAAKISDVRIEAEKSGAVHNNATYSANFIKSYLSELKFNAPLTEQLASSTFVIEGIIVSDPSLTVPEALAKISVTEEARNIKIDLHDVRLSEFGGYIENVIIDGSFDHENILKDLQIVSVDGAFSEKSPKFPKISAILKNLGNEQFEVDIIGNVEEFELTNSNEFIGVLPGANFVIDLELDTAVSKLASASKINFNTLSAANINGAVEISFGSEPLMSLGCEFLDCDLSDFNLSYKVNFDEEWVKGSATCQRELCGFLEMDHLVRTSNTVNIFTTLNRASILNPLSSLYLFGALTSGKKINGGHELNFKF